MSSLNAAPLEYRKAWRECQKLLHGKPAVSSGCAFPTCYQVPWTRLRNTPSTSKQPSPARLVHHCRCEGLTDPVARAFFERAHRKRTRLYVEDARPACACVYAQIESRGHAPNVSARQGLSNVWIWAWRHRSRHRGEKGALIGQTAAAALFSPGQ